MKDSERELLRRELVRRLTAIYRTVKADVDDELVERLVADPEDEAEEAAAADLRDTAAQLNDRDRQLAHLIEDALIRLRTDDYGVCADCGREIPFERLRAVPWTERCADDQTRVEG